MCLFVAENKRAQTPAEPSVEGPVGKITGNRPLNNQSPVNPTVPSKTQKPGLGLHPGLRVQMFSSTDFMQITA